MKRTFMLGISAVLFALIASNAMADICSWKSASWLNRIWGPQDGGPVYCWHWDVEWSSSKGDYCDDYRPKLNGSTLNEGYWMNSRRWQLTKSELQARGCLNANDALACVQVNVYASCYQQYFTAYCCFE